MIHFAAIDYYLMSFPFHCSDFRKRIEEKVVLCPLSIFIYKIKLYIKFILICF